MRNKAALAWLGLLLAAPVEACRLEASKTLLAARPNGYTAYWTMTDDPAWELPYAGGDARYREYRDWVRSNTSWSPLDNLANHIKVVEAGARRWNKHDRGLPDLHADARAARRMLEGRTGILRPMSCLEGLAFVEFLKVVDLRLKPREYRVSILKKGGRVTMLGDFYAEDGPGVAASKAASEEVTRLSGEGWTLFADYHNHPFDFSGEDVGGVLVPSRTDLRTYLSIDPQAAIITNGVDTMQMNRDELAELR